MDLAYNPLSVQEDIFVATNKESKADVKVLQGDLTVGNLNDLEYFLQKIITAIGVPKAYLAYEKDIKTKGVISSQDIQFARIGAPHPAGDGRHRVLRTSSTWSSRSRASTRRSRQYTIGLPLISIEDDLRTWQTEQLKMLTAGMFKETFWPSDEYVFKNYLGYDDDQTKSLLKGQKVARQVQRPLRAPCSGGWRGAGKGKAGSRRWQQGAEGQRAESYEEQERVGAGARPPEPARPRAPADASWRRSRTSVRSVTSSSLTTSMEGTNDRLDPRTGRSTHPSPGDKRKLSWPDIRQRLRDWSPVRHRLAAGTTDSRRAPTLNKETNNA
jgi:hypothetical protein